MRLRRILSRMGSEQGRLAMTKLKKGAKGADVKALQEMLNKAGDHGD